MTQAPASSPGTPDEAPRGAIVPRLIAFFSGSVGVAREDRTARDVERARSVGGIRAHRSRPLDRARGAHRDDRSDRRALFRAAHAAREVPAAGRALPPRLPDRPDHLHDRRGVHELLDRSHPQEVERDLADRAHVAPASRERQAVLHGACPRLRRRPRARAQGSGERRDLRRYGKRLDAGAAERREGERPRDHGGQGLLDHQGQRALRARPDAARVPRADDRRELDHAAGRSRRRSSSSRRCATTRRPTRSRASATA